MSKYHTIFLECPACHRKVEYVYWDSVNTSLDPELKEKILDKSIFLCSCNCGHEGFLFHPILYHDMEKNLMIQYVQPEDVYDAIKSFDEFGKNEIISNGIKKIRLRIVTDINYLIEKIHIFDMGLDDKIIEIIKCIYKKAYLQSESPAKDFDFIFCPPDYDSENEEEQICHLKLINYENNTYIVLPIDRNKFAYYSELIESQKKNKRGNNYIIQQEWADSIIDGKSQTGNGYLSILEEELNDNREKYKTEYLHKKETVNNINELDDDGYTLLKYAVMSEDYDEVKSLLENGADPNMKMAENRIVLHWALQYGISTKIIDLLIKYGGDINTIASHKLRPLDMINENCSVDYLKHMFELGAMCNGESLIRSFARNADSIECIKYLIEKGFSLDARDKNDFNATCEAICNNSSNEFLDQYLSLGGNPNEKYHGIPCLFSDIEEYNNEKRIKGYYIERLKILFNHGADINIMNSNGKTAIMYACKFCHRIEMLDFLLKYNPDLSLKDTEGKNAYDYLNENENLTEREKESIRFLLMNAESK